MKFKKIFSNWAVKNILLSIIVVAALAGISSILMRQITHHGEKLSVPDLTGMSVAQASQEAKKYKMRIDVTDSIYVRNIKRGSIVKQNPAAGTSVKEGRRIILTINAKSPKMTAMPNLIGYSLRSALADMSSRGLEVGRLNYINDIATNNVLSQLYNGSEIAAGEMISSGSRIDLVLGLNRQENTTAVPVLYGCKYRRAVEKVHESSLNVGRIVFDREVRNYQDSISAVVYRQSPEPFEICTMGRNVTFYLTLDESKVPSIESLKKKAAELAEETEL